MKNQRKKTEARSFRFSAVAIVLLMLATLICSFTVLTSAETTKITVAPSDLTFGTTIKADAAGGYYKVYDGSTDADVTVDPTVGIDAADQQYVELVVKSATFDSKDVETATKITVTFAVQLKDGVSGMDDLLDKYQAPRDLSITAKIKPATLSWATEQTDAAGNTSNVGVNVTYVPGQTTYNVNTLTAPAITGMATVNGTREDAPTVTSQLAAAVNGVSGVGTYYTSVNVTLNNKNYVIAPLKVAVTVDPLQITKITWNLPKTAFTWGDADLAKISVTGFDAQDKPYALAITYGEGFGNVGTHTLTASSPDANYVIGNSVSATTSITINKKVFEVTFADATYFGNTGIQADPTVFMLTVAGDIPANVRALITYTINGVAFTGASDYGVYTVTAKLPSSDNYEFKGVTNGTLTATMTILKTVINAGTADAPYLLILVNEKGFADGIKADVTIPEINRRALRGYKAHVEYTLNVAGAAGDTFTVLIPISDTLYGKRISELTAADLYIYEDVNGTMTSASELNYTVTVKDGYVQIDGISGSGSITFVLAPEYNTPFWLTPWGIALLVLLVLLFIALLIIIGLYLKRVRLSEENEETVIDTEGEVPAVVPAEEEDTVDADAVLAENADQLADELANEVDAEAAEEDTEGVEDAVAESMGELMDEVSAIELEKEVEETVEETVDETDVAADMADAKADELADAVENEDVEAEADEDALRAAVADALAENFNESADATDAIAILAVAEEDTDEITPEDFKAVVDAIVSEAMSNTMVLSEAVEETAEEAVEATEEVAEATEEVAEATEEVAEATEEVAEATEEVTEATEEVAEATEEVTEATEEVAEATEETAEATEETAEATEEIAEATEEIVVEEMSNDDICAIVADSVAEAFELVAVDGVAPKAVEGTTVETITEAVNNAADANIPETWTEAMAEAVKEAVVDELAARLIVEEPAVEAFAEIVEEKPETDEDDDDNDNDEDDDDGFGGFGSMPLDFIDAVAEADKYAAMLEDERNGFVRIVTRYKRSFQSRLSQSQGNVQEYYNIIKNALLSYKGVKNRISWNYEAFNRGRTHVAKINAKTKTLYLYLALDPAELADTKYGIVDMSSKKKYASVPVLMKIKGERKFKYALELIEKLCGENLTLPKLENEEVDYRIPYQTTEELVEAGIVKKLVASVPIVYSEADPAPEAAAEETTASATAEAQEVTFVAPTDAPAVEAAAEEVAAEEIPANAEASEEENKEI